MNSLVLVTMLVMAQPAMESVSDWEYMLTHNQLEWSSNSGNSHSNFELYNEKLGFAQVKGILWSNTNVRRIGGEPVFESLTMRGHYKPITVKDGVATVPFRLIKGQQDMGRGAGAEAIDDWKVLAGHLVLRFVPAGGDSTHHRVEAYYELTEGNGRLFGSWIKGKENKRMYYVAGKP